MLCTFTKLYVDVLFRTNDDYSSLSLKMIHVCMIRRVPSYDSHNSINLIQLLKWRVHKYKNDARIVCYLCNLYESVTVQGLDVFFNLVNVV